MKKTKMARQMLTAMKKKRHFKPEFARKVLEVESVDAS
jgi:hypothetical protein